MNRLLPALLIFFCLQACASQEESPPTPLDQGTDLPTTDASFDLPPDPDATDLSCSPITSCEDLCGPQDDGCGATLNCPPCETTGITLSPAELTLEIGEQQRLTPLLVDAQGQRSPAPKALWRTNAPEIASVSDDGVVTAHASGLASITAIIDPFRASITVAVRAHPIEVDAGAYHTCARTTQGELYCWGLNSSLQLGDAQAPRYAFQPNKVPTARRYQYLDTGSNHTCAIDRDSYGAFCWGRNYRGQLGNGDTSYRNAPTSVISPFLWGSISAGEEHSCAVNLEHLLFCWGDNAYGQLGTGDLDTRTILAPTLREETIEQVDTGARHSCALDAAGTLYCWGDNLYGQLGQGDRVPHTYAKPIPDLPPLKDVAASELTTCALSLDGVLYCWGKGDHGQLGLNTLESFTSPTNLVVPSPTEVVAPGLEFAQITVGREHVCALTDTNQLFCWGNNRYGALGLTQDPRALTPTPVDTDLRFSSIVTSQHASAVDLEHTCALTFQGELYCWGGNNSGQLGTGEILPKRRPTKISLPPLREISPARGHNLALTTENKLYAWGNNDQRYLGLQDNTALKSPTAVLTERVFATISAGAFHSCSLSNQGLAFCWGLGIDGRLGSGNAGSTATPTQVDSTLVFRQISAGSNHTCALDANSQAHCWGNNGSGQLGDGSRTQSLIPIPVSFPTPNLKLSQLQASTNFSCALSDQGQAFCWGNNGSGRLGVGDYVNKTTPTAVRTEERFSQIATGAAHTCALDASGKAFCWGFNGEGQLGNNSTANATTPKPVDTELRFRQISAAYTYTCALTFEGQAYCWGSSGDGQRGDGTAARHFFPQPVALPGATQP